jgi:hypothetical protein
MYPIPWYRNNDTHLKTLVQRFFGLKSQNLEKFRIFREERVDFKDILREKMAHFERENACTEVIFPSETPMHIDTYIGVSPTAIPLSFGSSSYRLLPKKPRFQREKPSQSPEISIEFANLGFPEQAAWLSLNRWADRPIPEGKFTLRELNRVYRSLVRRFHPDVNPTPEAKERFLAVTECFNLLQAAAKSAPALERKAA